MKISIVGSGYVGIVSGIGFAELGNEVVFVDVDNQRIDTINAGKPPIYEKELNRLMERNKERYYAISDYKQAIEDTETTFICVGTPSREDGSMDLVYVKSASEQIGEAIRDKNDFHVVIMKSTVVPGTTDEVVKPIIEQESGKRAFDWFGLAMNPEFLREGNAVYDFFNPDRLVLGAGDERTEKMLQQLYADFNCEKLITDIKTAEMIKYVSNSFLAAKISFANEVGNICKKLGIDTYEVFKGVGLDHRINPSFFRAGLGYGGSCFPKDVKALVYRAKELGEEPRIMDAVIGLNEKQPVKLVELLKKHVPELKGRKIGVLGLAFKPDTDDIRESRAIPVVRALLDEGANVVAYDPKAMEEFSKLFPAVEYAGVEEVLNCDVVLIVTEWDEFESLDYTDKIVIDGRKVEKARKEARIYEGVCW